jgi:flagellar hook-basal body complex protein FliE
MAINFIKAASIGRAAYAARTKSIGDAAPSNTAPSFTQVVEKAAKSAIDTIRGGEKASVAGITGKTDIREVVATLSSAEVTLQSVVAIRDKMVQAYQDLMRMPI